MATLPFDPFDQKKLREEADRDAKRFAATEKTRKESEKRRKELTLKSQQASVERDLKRVTDRVATEKREEQEFEQKKQARQKKIQVAGVEEKKAKQTLQDKERVAKTLKERLETLRKNVATFLSRLQQKESNKNEVAEVLKNTVAKDTSLKQASQGLAAKERDQVQEIQKKEAEITQLQRELTVLQNEYSHTKDEKRKLDDDVRGLTSTKSRTSSQESQQTRELNALASEKEKLEKEKEAKEEEARKAEEAILLQKKTIADLEATILGAEKEMQILTQQHMNAETHIRQDEAEQRRLEAIDNKIKSDLMGLR